MARKAPTGIHSEFRERIAVTVRAPEGDSMRALQMQRLVQEMNERHASGHLIEWVTSALLDKIASEMALEQGLNVPSQKSQWPGPANLPGEGREVEPVQPVQPVRLVQPVQQVQPEVKGEEYSSVADIASDVPKKMPAGLRGAM